jgi:hypothetical protein
MSDCDAREIGPWDVVVPTFETFHQCLINDSLTGEPKRIDRDTRAAWNLAARTIAGWPDVTVPVPNISRRYALGWADFLESFRVDAEAFLYRGANPDPFSDDYAKPVKASTVDMRRRQILQIATALVRSGHPASAIPDLATLALVPNATAALRYFRERPGGKLTTYTHQQALLLKTIARHWAKASADEVSELTELCRRLAVKKTGMTEKNRERLRQFDNLESVAALVHLPALCGGKSAPRTPLARTTTPASCSPSPSTCCSSPPSASAIWLDWMSRVISCPSAAEREQPIW